MDIQDVRCIGVLGADARTRSLGALASSALGNIAAIRNNTAVMAMLSGGYRDLCLKGFSTRDHGLPPTRAYEMSRYNRSLNRTAPLIAFHTLADWCIYVQVFLFGRSWPQALGRGWGSSASDSSAQYGGLLGDDEGKVFLLHSLLIYVPY